MARRGEDDLVAGWSGLITALESAIHGGLTRRDVPAKERTEIRASLLKAHKRAQDALKVMRAWTGTTRLPAAWSLPRKIKALERRQKVVLKWLASR